MALLDLWRSSQSELENKRVHQVLAVAGTGRLQDGSDTSAEFRAFLGQVPSRLLTRYADECLTEKFEQGGFALQDVINEIGRRLGLGVEDGRYKGTAGQSGHDGLWSSGAHVIVVEVKTTDAYRINLDTLAGYRRQLVSAGRLSEENSSMLIVVGRQDTGDLEAQIRGSRYGWNIRLISIDALVRLLRLKETVADPAILQKIVGILLPREFTRVDGIIELVFATAEDVREDAEAAVDDPDVESSTAKPTKRPQVTAFYDACIARASAHLGVPLSRESRTVYTAPDKKTTALCLVSKVHTSKSTTRYWYGFNPGHRDLLASSPSGYLVLGCGSPERVLLIPWRDFEPWLGEMFTTDNDGRSYWHISIDANKLHLLRRKGAPKVNVSKYLV